MLSKPNVELRKVSLAGGAPITLAEDINGSQWAFGAWIPNGTIVFGSVSGTLRRVSAEGGAVEEIVPFEAGERSHNFPAWVPEAGAVLFTTFAVGDYRIEAALLESGERRTVVDHARAPHVLDSGHLLFQRDAVPIAPFDTRELRLTGPAVPMIDAVQQDDAGNASVAQLAVSRGGTLAYLPAVATANRLGFVDRDGTFDALELPPGDYSLPRVSRDGRTLAFSRRAASRATSGSTTPSAVRRRSSARMAAPQASPGTRTVVRWPSPGLSTALAPKSCSETSTAPSRCSCLPTPAPQ